MTLPSEILAFKLLKKANITKEEKMLVLTGINHENRKTLFEEAKQSLKKFKGNRIHEKEKTIKPALFAEKQEALLASGFVRKSTQRRGEVISEAGYQHSNHRNRGSKTLILLDRMDKCLRVNPADPTDKWKNVRITEKIWPK